MSATLDPLEPTAVITAADQLAQLLGLSHPVESERELERIVSGRLDPAAIESLQSNGLTPKEIAALIIPVRTLSHRKARSEPLSVGESDRAVRVARLMALAASVFGSAERGLGWLRSPLTRFDGAAPMTLLVTEAGARLVEDLLIQIDEGYAG
jgi:putative toxin-antitoxin system antitoxin component (TIGR02293 family)